MFLFSFIYPPTTSFFQKSARGGLPYLTSYQSMAKPYKRLNSSYTCYYPSIVLIAPVVITVQVKRIIQQHLIIQLPFLVHYPASLLRGITTTLNNRFFFSRKEYLNILKVFFLLWGGGRRTTTKNHKKTFLIYCF